MADQPPQAPEAQNRDYDIVLFGATGFSGKLAAEYFATHYLGQGTKLKVALAGRNREKLEALRTDLSVSEPAASGMDILVGDSGKLGDMEAIVQRTRVVASTAGPYSQHGSLLVQACAEGGTNYCDITGEASWVGRMAALHHAVAERTGARIICCAGFDSVPSDVGTFLAVNRFKADFGVELERVDAFVHDISGGVQGGTVNTVMNELSSPAPPLEIRDAPEPLGTTQVEYPKGLWYDDRVRLWTIPYFMSPANYPVVKRSNAQLGYAKGLTYKEHMAGSLPFCTIAGSALVSGGLSLVFPPTRRLLRRLLPSSGEGPSRATMLSGRCSIIFLASGRGKQLRLDWRARGDPSCVQTTIFLAETAACLALDAATLPSRGGVLTPVSALGDALWARLNNAKWARGDEGPAITAEFAPAA